MGARILLTLVFLCLAVIATDGCRSSRVARNARAVRNVGRIAAHTQRDNAGPTLTPAAAYSEAIHIDPDHAAYYYSRGYLLSHMGKCEAANADFEKANVAQPSFVCEPEAEQAGR